MPDLFMTNAESQMSTDGKTFLISFSGFEEEVILLGVGAIIT